MRIFGLIGYPLSHSFSKKFFTDKFINEDRHDCTYENFQIISIKELTSLIKNNPLINGLNVTIPYKEQVISFLYWKSKVVEETGACNCIKIKDDKLYGFNTDTIGFEQTLKENLLPHHRKALILGTGGASKAIGYVMRNLLINYSYVSRSNKGDTGKLLQYEQITDDMLQAHTLIINTTPLGMFPDINVAPPINYNLLTHRHFLYDLIYNPEKTLFLRKAEEKGAIIKNGYEMLVIQAEESWKIWNTL